MGRLRWVLAVLVCCLAVVSLPAASAVAITGSAQPGAIMVSFTLRSLFPGAATTVTVAGLTPGDSYTLGSDSVAIAQPTMVAPRASSDWQATVSADAAPGATVTVWVTAAADPTRLAQARTTVAGPDLNYFTASPWAPILLVGNFSAGEAIDLSYSYPIGGPATAMAGADAQFGTPTFAAPPPGATPSQVVITATGRTHHLSASTTVGLGLPVLHAGQSVSNTFWALATPTFGYSTEILGNVVLVDKWQHLPEGQATYTIAWQSPIGAGSPADPGTLTMQTDGNLVLTSKHQLSWSSGTAGTGTANYTVLQADGDLVVYTAQHRPVWSSQANGLVYQTAAYIASNRSGPAVYINGLIKLDNPKTGVIRDAGRVVYLQRYLGHRWQNVLARITSAGGQLSVGFISGTVQQYRLLAPATKNAAAAVSASTFR